MAKSQKTASMGGTSYGAFSINTKQQTGRQEESNFKDVD